MTPPADRSPEQGKQSPQSSVQSVECAARVIDCLASSGELGVSEIARRLGIAKSTSHRILTSLASFNLVARDPETHLYSLGIRVYELGQLVADRNSLRLAARPVMSQLALETKLSIVLVVPHGADVIQIERIEPDRSMAWWTGRGRSWPAHCAVGGKAISAFSASLANSRKRAGFPPLTSRSISSEREYQAELEAVRRQGYAIDREGVVIGQSGVGAPILHRSSPIGALSAIGPTATVKPSIRRLAGSIVRSARLIEAALR